MTPVPVLRATDVRPLASAVRVLPVVAGAVGLWAAGGFEPVWTPLVFVVTVVASLWPRTVLTAAAVGAVFVTWLATQRFGNDPSPARVVVFAAALYVMHSALAIGAIVPVTARVERQLLRRWLRRSRTVGVVSAVVIAGQYLIGSIGASGSLELIGFVAATVAVAATVLLIRWTSSAAERRGGGG